MPDEELLDEFAERYIQRYIQEQIQQQPASGINVKDIESNLDAPSFILSIKMLRNYLAAEVPGGETVVESLAEVMQETPDQSREILARFVARGWLSSDYQLTPAGLALVGPE